MQHKAFDYATEQDFLLDRNRLASALPYVARADLLGTGMDIGGKRIENRFLAQPIEGFDALEDGSPSERSIKRYCRYAAGMSGTIWIESVAVNEQGRSNPAQFWIAKENTGAFRALNEAMRQAARAWGRPYTVIQLTHSGRYSAPFGVAAPACAVSNPYIHKENEYILTDDALEQLEDDYVTAALLAEQAGFDAVDIRCCHGYIINELLGARERPGRYGGTFENRVRFVCRVIDKIRASSQIEIAVRLNVFDSVPYPYGFGVSEKGEEIPDMEEPLRLVRLLYGRGVRLLNISCGIGAYSPQVIRPSDMGGPLYRKEHPLEGVDRMLSLTKQVKQAVPDAIVAASALTWLREYGAGIASGCIREGWFDLAGFGRQALCYPDYAKDTLQNGGMLREECCITCNGCMTLIKKNGNAIRCVIKEEKD